MSLLAALRSSGWELLSRRDSIYTHRKRKEEEGAHNAGRDFLRAPIVTQEEVELGSAGNHKVASSIPGSS